MEASLVWIAAADGGSYTPGTVLDGGASTSGDMVVCAREVDDGVVHAPASALLPRNALESAESADLSHLVHLNEPCIVHALRLRYTSDAIVRKQDSNPHPLLASLAARRMYEWHARSTRPSAPSWWPSIRGRACRT